MKKASLVFLPSPGAGHLGSAVEMAQLLVNHNHQISVTVLIYKFPNYSKPSKYIDSLSASSTSNRIQFIHLLISEDEDTKDKQPMFFTLVERQKPNLREAVTKLISSESFPPLAGFVLDMFFLPMIDVANEFAVPSYLFFTSTAAALGFLLHTQILYEEQNLDLTQFKDSDTTLDLPTLMNPPPGKVFPYFAVTKERPSFLLDFPKRCRQTKGIIVNTFLELETYAINALNSNAIDKLPLVYPIGPILNLKGNEDGSDADESKGIMKWLDEQPSLSVIFLCFGSLGSFGGEQVKEIASAIENTGYRFLWSLRKPTPKGQIGSPNTDYVNPQEILPEGFLERTAETGKLIGWAPQTAILGHPAICGFVSHCGWNSTLESIWFGVPIATWPLYAEQQLNAFQMVVDLGLAVEIKMDYRKEFGEETEMIISAAEIEKGVRSLMEIDVDKRNKVKKLSEISRKALMENGSSHTWLSRFCADVIENV